MITGESWFGECFTFGNLSKSDLGSATNTVGSHSPPGIGFGAVFYDGADQITLEEVRTSPFYHSALGSVTYGLLIQIYSGVARIPFRSLANRNAHDLETRHPVLLPAHIPRTSVQHCELDIDWTGDRVGCFLLHCNSCSMR